MRVFIRADASTQIGTGHVMRCLTLAGDLRQFGMEVSFISRVLPGDLCDYVESKGFIVHRLAEEVDFSLAYWKWLGENWLADAIKTQEIILYQAGEQSDIDHVNTEKARIKDKFLPDDCLINKSSYIVAQVFSDSGTGLEWGKNINLVVDSYALDYKWETFFRPYVDKIMVIDDLANRTHDCDLLLDQNYYRELEHRYDRLVPSTCRKLLGPEYALLRPEFHKAKKTLKKRDGKIRRILIFFGGSDPTNETKKALQAIKLLKRPEIAVDVVVGAANPHQEEIRQICDEIPNTTYYCQVENMAELMAAADLAIGAGGTTSWERIYLDLPTVAIAIAENQVETLKALGNEKKLYYLGINNEVTIIDIYSEIKRLLNQKE